MPLSRRTYLPYVLLIGLCTIAATGSGSGQVAFRLPYKVIQDSMIVVPVSINHTKAVEFVLDTGTTRTVVDERMARELALVQTGETTLSGIQGSAAASVVKTDAVSMGGATVAGMRVSVRAEVPLNVRGVLGEDFLRNFDLLIDNRHHRIEFEPYATVGSGAGDRLLVANYLGEHLPLRFEGYFHGQPTQNRLLVVASANELGDRQVALQLDSGSNVLMLFNQPESLRSSWGRQTYRSVSLFSAGGSVSNAAAVVRFLHLGSQTVHNVTVAAPSQNVDVDVEGILPTSVFGSILICHSGGFAILNPSRKRPH